MHAESGASSNDSSTMLSPTNGANEATRGKLKQRRSRKACHHCHTRKIRCNVLESGTPCSNCVDAGTTCIIRRRKNQRRESTPPDHGHRVVLDQAHALPAHPAWTNNSVPQQPIAPRILPVEEPATGFAPTGVQNQIPSSTSPQSGDGRVWADVGPEISWDHSAVVDTSSASCDFSHLNDLDDILTFTGNTFLPSFPQAQDDFSWNSAYPVPNQLSPQSIVPGASANDCVPFRRPSFVPASFSVPGLNPTDHEYLRGEGCFDLPSAQILRQMMQMYFKMNHPNLPVVAEEQFWSLWNGDEFRASEYSLLLLRAMIFAATSASTPAKKYLEPEMLSSIGFVSKREARNTYYRQAKLLYDFGIEKNPIVNAQVCLLLSYNAPNYNFLRINSYWVSNAIRFAKIARADSYYRIRDPVKSRLLKRIWWGVIFRDRILSLGLRRSIQFELDESWADGDRHILTTEDFQSELGNSPVHDMETQLRIMEMIRSTCRLMQCLSGACKILYHKEHLDDRLEHVSKSITATVSQVRRCLDSLRQWHEQAIRLFPFPISLDDAHETICVYANMMFSYHTTAVFGLNTYLILMGEVFPTVKPLFSLDEAKEALEAANSDVSRRTQELVQVRLVKYLPISASAILALPLILQAINVAAARGSGMEAVEIRRLDVFTRTLKSQQQSFDGSDFCADILANVVSYAQDDTKFVSSMTTARRDHDKEGTTGSPMMHAGTQVPHKIKLDWCNLVFKRPRLFLRLVLYLDRAFSTGGPPQDEDFPAELQKGFV